jgi:hypothetical protein
MHRYQFVIGVSLSALEAELNRIVKEEPFLALRGFTFAHGIGFIAVVERSEGNWLGHAEQAQRPKGAIKEEGKRRKR